MCLHYTTPANIRSHSKLLHTINTSQDGLPVFCPEVRDCNWLPVLLLLLLSAFSGFFFFCLFPSFLSIQWPAAGHLCIPFVFLKIPGSHITECLCEVCVCACVCTVYVCVRDSWRGGGDDFRGCIGPLHCHSPQIHYCNCSRFTLGAGCGWGSGSHLEHEVSEPRAGSRTLLLLHSPVLKLNG